MRIYLDTSIPSTYFDSRTPERQEVTQKFWRQAVQDGVTLCVSNIVIAEIQRTPSEEKRDQMLQLISPLEKLVTGPEASKIAEAIIV